MSVLLAIVIAALAIITLKAATVLLAFLFNGLLILAILVVLVVIGAVGDYRYSKKVARGVAEWRLPFYYRWKGWTLGSLHSSDMDGYRAGLAYDHKRNIFIPMVRPSGLFE